MTLTRTATLLALAAAAAGLSSRVAATRAETQRTVYVSATDSKGAPVTDLKATDLSVKEGGQERTIVGLKIPTDPMDVAILVEDRGTGNYQQGVLQFLQAVGEHGKFSIRQFSPQAVKILDYGDTEISAIQGALDKLGRRGKIDGEGEQIIDAISVAAKELQQRKAARRVIMLFTVSGEGKTRNPDIVMNELAASGAILHVVHQTNADIGLVTGDGPKQSGGRIEQAGAVTAIQAGVTKITDALANQYALTYTLPDGVKPSDRVSVSTNRKGISLLAPSRIPDK
jgi:hypothetical protein